MEVSLQSFRKRFTYDPQKDLLGKGGFGEVYKAYDNEDQVYVALKISQGTADDKYNLINEIKQFKKLNHPNIVNHIEAYEVNTGSTDIHGKPILYHVGILEYADKGTLADFLKSKTPIGFRQTIEDLANDIIDGLAYLHSQNIIHRDLKPTNILLFSEGEKLRAKITDFGIAKQADATAASTQLVGTVEYMAPEYFTTGNITKASDIWSLGVMLLEALSGTHPFGKTTQGLSNEQIIRNILSKDLQENLVNAPLKELPTRCLMREANLRPQSAEELKGLMQSSGDAFTERTQIISTKKKVSETEKGKSKWHIFVLILIVFTITTIIYIAYQKYQSINSKDLTIEKPPFDSTKPYKVLRNGKWITVNPIDTLLSPETTSLKLPSPQEALRTENTTPINKSKNRKVYCWYGYQEKKLSNGWPIEVIDITNYATDIFELIVPPKITDGEVARIVEQHIKENCPVIEKADGKNYHYTITGKIGPVVTTTFRKATEARNESLSEDVTTYSICSEQGLQNKISNAVHYSANNPNQSGITMYCVVGWSKLSYNSSTSKFDKWSYVSQPIKIKCVTDANANLIGDLLKYHVKENCSNPDGYTVMVSTLRTYQSALDYIQEQFPEGEERDVCRLDFFQQTMCKM